MRLCAVQWCLDRAAAPRGVCRLHADHPVLHSREQPGDYFARLRTAGVGAVERKSRKTADVKQVLLIDERTSR